MNTGPGCGAPGLPRVPEVEPGEPAPLHYALHRLEIEDLEIRGTGGERDGARGRERWPAAAQLAQAREGR